MQYCPHCERPVRALVGECPHCRRPLDAAPSAPESAPPAAAAPGDAAVRPVAPEVDLPEAEGPALELSFDPRERAAMPAVAAAPAVRGSAPPGPEARRSAPAPEAEATFTPEEIARAAGVSRPPHPLLSSLYAVRALRRLPALREEVQARREEAERAESLRREAFAAWAREHAPRMDDEPAMRPVLDAAAQAQAALEGFQAAHGAEFEKHLQAEAGLQEEERLAEQEKGRLRDELAVVDALWEAHDEDVQHARVKLRRIDIELRNLHQLAGGPIGPDSPHHARSVELSAARAEAAAETARAEAEAAPVREDRERLHRQIAAVEARVAARRREVLSDPARVRLEESRREHERAAEEALAAVTAEALARKLVVEEKDADRRELKVAADAPVALGFVVPRDVEEGRRLRAVYAAAAVARRARRLHEEALASIDRRAIAAGIAVPSGVLAALIVLLAVLRC